MHVFSILKDSGLKMFLDFIPGVINVFIKHVVFIIRINLSIINHRAVSSSMCLSLAFISPLLHPMLSVFQNA